jgi:hypothetical protein
MDLVVDVIPEICRRFPLVHFIIGGDGPKRLLLEVHFTTHLHMPVRCCSHCNLGCERMATVTPYQHFAATNQLLTFIGDA